MNKSKLPTLSVDNSVSYDVVMPQRQVIKELQRTDHFLTTTNNLLILHRIIGKNWKPMLDVYYFQPTRAPTYNLYSKTGYLTDVMSEPVTQEVVLISGISACSKRSTSLNNTKP